MFLFWFPFKKEKGKIKKRIAYNYGGREKKSGSGFNNKNFSKRGCVGIGNLSAVCRFLWPEGGYCQAG